jgi:hypothetical protein
MFPEAFMEYVRIAGDMRGQDHIVEPENRVIRGWRLRLQNVEAGRGDPAFAESADECLLVDDLA